VNKLPEEIVGLPHKTVLSFAGAGIPTDYAQKNIALPLAIFPGTVIDDTCCVSFTDTTECWTF
jgi:hypothetical protein